MNISVLGCGRWGSCIAWYLDKIGNNVISCGLADAPEFIQLSTTHKNDYLTFPESIEVTSDLAKAVNHAEVIVISISSQHLSYKAQWFCRQDCFERCSAYMNANVEMK